MCSVAPAAAVMDDTGHLHQLSGNCCNTVYSTPIIPLPTLHICLQTVVLHAELVFQTAVCSMCIVPKRQWQLWHWVISPAAWPVVSRDAKAACLNCFGWLHTLKVMIVTSLFFSHALLPAAYSQPTTAFMSLLITW